MITSLAIMSYMGRFSSAKQAAYYVGLVPRVDISGVLRLLTAEL
ncbi:transposase, IS116/IS110/IS902 domain protein [Leptospira noguchii str. 2001034031]|uniref:Transposase, IS116/IS110/IS902 domain protein n=1 Tax=Leptospira noguchii str. 2001034031 TaxID=1193053 RepID=M6YZ28_9LEPT|nr:transposase, IS116/IS110/IS902 domain protein [Leptospira noguchii str. 2001034031]